jgi:hypothetical protein
MIKLLCFFPILCASIAITPHASPSPIVSVKAHPVYKTNKNVLTSTASVIKTIDSTPIENVKLYTKNKTFVKQNNTSILQNKTSVLQNKTFVKQNNTNVSQVQEKTTHYPKNNIKKQSYSIMIMKICIIIFVILIVMNLYYKLKKIVKPTKNQYLPYNVIDKKPIIHVTRNEFNPYNRDNEQCYKRLSGNNSPV